MSATGHRAAAALYDIGCYAIVSARYIFGAEPTRVAATIDRDPNFATDRLAGAILEFPGGRHSTFTVGTQMSAHQRVTIVGDAGRIEIMIPFNAPPDRPTEIAIDPGADLFGGGRRVEQFPVCDQYTLQGDAFSRAIIDGTPLEFPIEDAILNMRVLDAAVPLGQERIVGKALNARQQKPSQPQQNQSRAQRNQSPDATISKPGATKTKSIRIRSDVSFQRVIRDMGPTYSLHDWAFSLRYEVSVALSPRSPQAPRRGARPIRRVEIDIARILIFAKKRPTFSVEPSARPDRRPPQAGAFPFASSARTAGATTAPRSSIERRIAACGWAPTCICIRYR